MNDWDDASHRRLARAFDHSLLKRETARLSRSQSQVIGVVPIRSHRDSRLLALAFGQLDDSWLGPPATVLTNTYLDTGEDGWLDPAVAFLDQHLRQPGGCQLWLPDEVALDTLAIEGARSLTNPRSTRLRRRFGAMCRAITRIRAYHGQQAVAIATEVHQQHSITGLDPQHDDHLEAVLVWVGPPDRYACRVDRTVPCLWYPRASLLWPAEEEELERERPRLRQNPGAWWAEDDMARLLARPAWRTWDLLRQAYAAYLALPLRPLLGTATLERDSQVLLTALLDGGVPGDGSVLQSARVLWDLARWQARLEDFGARGDRVIRESLRLLDRVIAATPVEVRPSTGDQTWTVQMRTTQEVPRLCVGRRLRTEDGRIEGMVDNLRHELGSTLVSLRITKGHRWMPSLQPGVEIDWFATVVGR